MGNIFRAMEALDNSDLNNDTSFDNIMFDIIDTDIAYEEFINAANDYDDAIELEEDLESSVEEIESLIEVISKHGICKSTILAADPTGEFRNRNILPSVEDVNDVPTNDEYAEVSIEGLKEMAKKFWETIKEYVKKIWEFIKGLFSKVIHLMQSNIKLAMKYKKVLDDISIDDKKAADKKVMYFKKDAEDKIVNKKIYHEAGSKMMIGITAMMDKVSNELFDTKIADEDKAIAKGMDLKMKLLKDVLDKVGESGDPKFLNMKVISETDETYEIKIESGETAYPYDLEERSIKNISVATDYYKNLCELVITGKRISDMVSSFVKSFNSYTKKFLSYSAAAEKYIDKEKIEAAKTAVKMAKEISGLIVKVQKTLVSCMTKSDKVMLTAVAKAISCQV